MMKTMLTIFLSMAIFSWCVVVPALASERQTGYPNRQGRPIRRSSSTQRRPANSGSTTRTRAADSSATQSRSSRKHPVARTQPHPGRPYPQKKVAPPKKDDYSSKSEDSIYNPYHPQSSSKYSKYPKYPSKKSKKCAVVNTCKCHSEYVLSSVEASYLDHIILASHQGCTLATASNQIELHEMVEVAMSARTERGLENNNAYIGAARSSLAEFPVAKDGTPYGPWKWIDGCTKYSFDIFKEPPTIEQDDNGNVRNVAVIRVLSGEVLAWRRMPYADAVDDDGQLAVYECCKH